MLRILVLFAVAVWLPLHICAFTAKGDSDNEAEIVVQMEIFDVSDLYFERLEMDLEALLPKPTNRFVDEAPGIGAHDIDLSNPVALNGVEILSAEEQQGYAILTPLESRLLHRFMKKEDCHLILRPHISALSGKKVEYELDRNPPINVGFGELPPLPHMNGEDVKVTLEFVATLTEDGKAVTFKIKGQSEGELSRLHASLPQGKILLISLGSHVVEYRSEQSVPILNKVPYASRLFKNTGIARQTWHRLLYVTCRKGEKIPS